MSARLVLAMSLALVPACSLIANPNDHTGHTRDGSVLPDMGPHDAYVPPVDTGVDAYAPPECTTAADCGSAGAAGIVQCVASRCVFCAAPTEPTPYELRHAANLRPYVSIGVRRRPTGPALIVVGSMGDSAAQPALAHRLAIDAPSGAMDQPLADAIMSGCSAEAFDSVSSIAFIPDESSASSTATDIAVIAQGAMGGMITQLSWYDTTGTIQAGGFTCRTLDAPADFVPTTVLIRPPNIDGTNTQIEQVTYEATDATSFRFASYSYPYANMNHSYTSFGGPTGTYVAMTSAGPFMIVGGDTNDHMMWWDPEITNAGPSPVMTPDRTGDPVAVMTSASTTMASELLHFVSAYPVGNRVRLLNVDCDSSCNPVGESADVRTDAMAVTAARLGMVTDVPVLLTSEHLTSGDEQVVLRVLRPNATSYDAPGGGHALVLDTATTGSTITDIQFAIVGGTSTRYAAVWMVRDASGTSSLRVQTFDAGC